MSDDKWMNLPTGRRLEQPSYDPGYVGSLGPLRIATEASLRLARRNLREIPEKGVSQATREARFALRSPRSKLPASSNGCAAAAGSRLDTGQLVRPPD
jgi:hypothetical protein